MEQSDERGITPVNEDGPSLFTSKFEDPFLLEPTEDSISPFQGVGSTDRIQSCSNTVDSGLGPELEWDISVKPMIDSWFDSGSRSQWDSFGVPEVSHISAGIPISPTYQYDLGNAAVRASSLLSNDLRKPKETRHETTEYVQRISSPAANEEVSKSMNQPQELRTPPEPSYDSHISSNAVLNQGDASPLGTETTDSGDTEMHADEESLFDDHDAHLYTGHRWDGATIELLKYTYRWKLYCFVASKVLQRRQTYQAFGKPSDNIPACSSRPGPVKKRTKTGCLSCRKRRIKCGEERPRCNNCIRSKRECEGYIQRVVFKDSIGIFGAYNSDQALNALTQPMPSAATEQSTSNATGSAGVQDIKRQGSDGTSSGRKRKADEISDEDDQGGPYEGDGDGSQEPSKRFKASKSEDRALRFACPFFKRHPESFRTCGMSDHENSSRVKQHISRKHRMPIYCPRCSETFKTEHERDTHVRDADCPVGPKANFICATAEQLRKLSRRNTHQTDRENWNAIYKILFPDDPLPESPYLDPLVSHEVNLVREAFLTAAPVAVRSAIQQVIPGEFSDSLEEELQRVLRSTHAEVFDQILRRMREDREAGRVHPTTQSLLQTRVSSTPDSGIGSTIRPGSSPDEPEPTLHSQDRLASFASGSFDLQNDGAIPLPPLFGPGFEPSEYHMGNLPQSFPDGTFDDLSEYLDAPGDSFLTDQF